MLRLQPLSSATGSRLLKFRRHKPSGRAVVTLSGRDVSLGAFGSPEAKRAYGASRGSKPARTRAALVSSSASIARAAFLSVRSGTVRAIPA